MALYQIIKVIQAFFILLYRTDVTLPQCYEKAYQFFRDHKLEPFTPKKLERYITSAAHHVIVN